MAGLDDRRRWTRHPVCAPIEYNYDYGTPRQASRTLNISEGGALIPMRGFIGRGSNITLKIFLKNGYFVMRSRVAHVEKQRQDFLYHTGVEFLERPTDFTSKFRKELNDLGLYKIQCSKETGREVTLPEASARWYEKTAPML